MHTINKGSFNAAGKNYTYQFDQKNPKHFVLSIAENSKQDEEVKETQFRKVLQSVTSWHAVDPKNEQAVLKALEKGVKVIDSKINDIEVKAVINEKELIQEVEVLKTVSVYKPGKAKNINVFVRLNAMACQIFAQNYILNQNSK